MVGSATPTEAGDVCVGLFVCVRARFWKKRWFKTVAPSGRSGCVTDQENEEQMSGSDPLSTEDAQDFYIPVRRESCFSIL